MDERRTEPRLLCAELVEIRWKDDNGRSREIVADLEDISTSGACLLTEHHIPNGTPAVIVHGKLHFDCTVRYSITNEIGHFIGVEFAEDTRWSQDSFEPEHLLDPREIRAPTPGDS